MHGLIAQTSLQWQNTEEHQCVHFSIKIKNILATQRALLFQPFLQASPNWNWKQIGNNQDPGWLQEQTTCHAFWIWWWNLGSRFNVYIFVRNFQVHHALLLHEPQHCTLQTVTMGASERTPTMTNASLAEQKTGRQLDQETSFAPYFAKHIRNWTFLNWSHPPHFQHSRTLTQPIPSWQHDRCKMLSEQLHQKGFGVFTFQAQPEVESRKCSGFPPFWFSSKPHLPSARSVPQFAASVTVFVYICFWWAQQSSTK